MSDTVEIIKIGIDPNHTDNFFNHVLS